MKVIVSAGGTGGHIYPALAIINKIKDLEPDVKFLYIGTTNRMEKDIVPKEGIPYLGIEISGLSRKNPFKNIKVIKDYLANVKKIRKTISEFQPDIVLGIGGYVTAPVLRAAKKENIKTFIHEQNSIPGITNKLLSKFVDKIGVSLESSLKYFPPSKTIFTGNPRSEEILKVKPILKSEIGLTETKKLVLIVMGSLGSTTMNKNLSETLPLFNNKDYEVMFVTGNDYYEKYKDLQVTSNVKIVPYLNNMINILPKTDLIISRAGASTIAEITALGIPSILIPSPYVTNNHQLMNAKALLESDATVIMEEKNYNGKELVSLVDEILNNKNKYLSLKENAKKLGISDSATRIYKVIKELIQEG